MQQVKAGLKAIYLSGWQVAADANLAGQMYPDQSLYPANSVPHVVKRINQALQRADQIHHAEGKNGIHWFAPIVADAEAGFGGALNVFELMKAMIEAGAAGVHFEDQLASEKKCGHMGGKVLMPTAQAVRNLDLREARGRRHGRPDDHRRQDRRRRGEPRHLGRRPGGPEVPHRRADDGGLLPGQRRHRPGDSPRPLLRAVRRRGVVRDLHAGPRSGARTFAEAIHAEFPGKLLAYNCSPSFNWKAKLSDEEIATFQQKLGEMGYKFQFITLAGFHALNFSMFELARDYRERGMAAYSELQQEEFDAEKYGYTATKHQREVGAGYFDEVAQVVAGGAASTTALTGSTEEAQFQTPELGTPEDPNTGLPGSTENEQFVR